MEKKIMVLKADGTSYQLPDKRPSLEEIQAIVGGNVEFVTVLGATNPAWVYTTMIVNEEGLIHNLPRNEAATKLYQRNIREQYPHAENPFLAAAEAMEARAASIGTKVIRSSPSDDYDMDPYICGDVIYFEGYNEDEVDALLS